jgi:hypothetical protein
MNEIFSNCRASLVYEFKYFNTIFMSDEGVAIKNKQIYQNLKKNGKLNVAFQGPNLNKK